MIGQHGNREKSPSLEASDRAAAGEDEDDLAVAAGEVVVVD